MIDYKFKYKSRFERRNFSQWRNKFFSDLLFFLYGNWFFKKLKFDTNTFLKVQVSSQKKRNVPKINSTTIPDNPNLNIHSITFLDCIEIEDSHKLQNRLIQIVSKYKCGHPSIDPSKELKKAFHKFDSAYKTTSWGGIYFNDTKDNDELDLIDSISYGYIKGSQSHFIITYTVHPSAKFQSLFKESLKSEFTKESEIRFKSFRQMIKTKKLFTSIVWKIKDAGYWTNKVLNEINFQFHSKVVSSLNLGIFNKNDRLTYPSIISFEYDPNEFSPYKNELFRILDISTNEHYTSSDIILTLKNIDYSEISSSNIQIFFPFRSEENKKNDPFNNIEFLDEKYIQALSPFWLLINVSAINRQNIVALRKKTFLYIRNNRVSLFLKKAIKLKNKLSIYWISFERLRKDFSTDIFKTNLRFLGIPDAHNIPWYSGAEPEEFKANLIYYAINTSKDIKKSFEELLDLFKHISEDNTIRANMRLQRFLLILAVIGIILAIYSANNNWCNSWIKYYFNKWNIEIPQVPKK